MHIVAELGLLARVRGSHPGARNGEAPFAKGPKPMGDNHAKRYEPDRRRGAGIRAAWLFRRGWSLMHEGKGRSRSFVAPPEGLEALALDDGRGLTLLTFPIDATDPLRSLTSAERAVLVGIFAGHTNADIARARNVAPRTIANQVATLFRKLNVTSRAELVASYVLFE